MNNLNRIEKSLIEIKFDNKKIPIIKLVGVSEKQITASSNIRKRRIKEFEEALQYQRKRFEGATMKEKIPITALKIFTAYLGFKHALKFRNKASFWFDAPSYPENWNKYYIKKNDPTFYETLSSDISDRDLGEKENSFLRKVEQEKLEKDKILNFFKIK